MLEEPELSEEPVAEGVAEVCAVADGADVEPRVNDTILSIDFVVLWGEPGLSSALPPWRPSKSLEICIATASCRFVDYQNNMGSSGFSSAFPVRPSRLTQDRAQMLVLYVYSLDSRGVYPVSMLAPSPMTVVAACSSGLAQNEKV